MTQRIASLLFIISFVVAGSVALGEITVISPQDASKLIEQPDETQRPIVL